jgi:hypothetical protein
MIDDDDNYLTPPIGDARDFDPAAPSNDEFLNGVRDDGTPVPILSKPLVDPFNTAIPGGRENAEAAHSMQELLLQYDMHALRDIELASSLLRKQVRITHHALDTGELPEGMTMNQCMTVGLAASRQLVRNAELTRQIAHEAGVRANESDVRRAFMYDRAHAVVANTLLALDDQFAELGFGSWMPFRYPDQWLMFCGVMRRILAANGLLTVDDPDVYRRLLTETPYVRAAEDEGPNEPPRMPPGWGRCERVRSVTSMQELMGLIRQDE